MQGEVFQHGEAPVECDAHILYCETRFQNGKSFLAPADNRPA